MSKFWEFKNQVDETNAQLLLYGPISETSWWGDEVTPKQFAKDLKDLGDVDVLDVRINSGGGDVFAAHAINNLLRASSAKIHVFIDGIAASAATIIAMAGEKIYMPTNAMMMIHDPLISLRGMYNIKDFAKFTKVLDKVKESIVAAYKSKTGKGVESIKDIMDEETWYTGQEAVEEGFADEVLYSEIDAVMNGNQVMINNVAIDLSRFENMPRFDDMNTREKPLNNKPSTTKPQNTQTKPKPEPSENIENTTKEGDKPMNKEELKNKHPELYNEIFQEGITNERTRLQAIDNIKTPGFDNVKNKAKYNTILDAGSTAMAILEAQNAQTATHIKNVQEDIEDSGVSNVVVDQVPQKEMTSAQEEEEVANNMAKFMNNKRGR